jgi:spermidine synthase
LFLAVCESDPVALTTLSVAFQALIIDGKTQSTEMDEFMYHESLIHPPLLFHPK